METMKILVVGRQADPRGGLMERLSGIPGWDVLEADSVETAIERLFEAPVDMVVLTETFEEAMERKLKKISGLCQDLIFLHGAGLEGARLVDQIRKAAGQRKWARLAGIRVHDTLDAASLANDIRVVP